MIEKVNTLTEPSGPGFRDSQINTDQSDSTLADILSKSIKKNVCQAREIMELLQTIAKGQVTEFKINDKPKLNELAFRSGIEVANLTVNEISLKIAEILEREIKKQSEALIFTSLAPKKRQDIWRQQGVIPQGIETELAEILRYSQINTENNRQSLIKSAIRAALADTLGNGLIIAELQDLIFGTPVPILCQIGQGFLKASDVNIVIGGHNPAIAEALFNATQRPELRNYALSKGAQGINLTCLYSADIERLMQHGIAILGDYSELEQIISSGAVETLVINEDFNCTLSGKISRQGHTQLICTDSASPIPGIEYRSFDVSNSNVMTNSIVKSAIDNFAKRGPDFNISKQKAEFIGGFNADSIRLLSGHFRPSYRPILDNIINGRISGVACIIGGYNSGQGEARVTLAKELIKNDVLVLQTGNSVIASARAGLMLPEGACMAGNGLASVCEAIGIPPVLNFGSDIDNIRLIVTAFGLIHEGGMSDFTDLPLVASISNDSTETIFSTGLCLAASGIFTLICDNMVHSLNPDLVKHLGNDLESIYGGKWALETDPIRTAHLLIEQIEIKRKTLGIDKARARVLFDMAMRRELNQV